MTDDGTERQLVDMLDHVWSSMADLGSTLDETEWKQPTECPGWTVQDNLVHITALERFILGDPLPTEDVPDDLPHVKNDVGRSNERWIESRRAWSGADALEEFRTATAARLEQLRGLDDDGFAADSWTPMGPGTVADLLGFRIFDSWVHEQDMRRARRPTRRPRLARGRPLARDDARGAPVHRREEGGGSRRFHRRAHAHRTAPAHRRRRGGGRPGAAARPRARRSRPSRSRWRRTPSPAWPAGAPIRPRHWSWATVAIDGDVELGGEIVRQLNYMF